MGVVATAGHHGLAEVLHGEGQARHLPIHPPQPDAYHEFQHSLKQQREGGPIKHRRAIFQFVLPSPMPTMNSITV
ncbi:hypothetical protein ACQJBY_054439 [Aegilops geniculata]